MFDKKGFLLFFSGLFFIIINMFSNSSMAMSEPKQAKNSKEFIQIMLPTVESINMDIQAQRERLLRLEASYSSKQKLSANDEQWLEQLAKSYKLKKPNLAKAADWSELKRRVDVIPPSMAIAQAANESAWGKSRFAKQGNNYFGQWCYQQGCGIIPKNRKVGAKHEVKKFNNAEASVRSYMNNLNSHFAYTELRDLRSKARKQNKTPEGLDLAVGLKPYAGNGNIYVNRITGLITRFNLSEFDKGLV